jgi:hypothetical protein
MPYETIPVKANCDCPLYYQVYQELGSYGNFNKRLSSMRQSLRLCVSVPKSSIKPPKTSRFRKAPPPSLEHFIQRQRSLHLYRDILRRVYSIPPSGKQKRDELIAYARGEFDRHRNVNDIGQIRYLISTGKTDMMGWERMIFELSGKG